MWLHQEDGVWESIGCLHLVSMMSDFLYKSSNDLLCVVTFLHCSAIIVFTKLGLPSLVGTRVELLNRSNRFFFHGNYVAHNYSPYS